MSDPVFERDPQTNDRATTHPQYASLIASGAGVVFLGTAIGDGLRYLFQLIVARHVGVELYGLFSLGFAAFNVGAVIASQGTGQSVVRFVSLYHGEGDQGRVRGTIYLAAALAVGGGLVLGLCLMALSEFLAIEVFHTAALAGLLRGFAVAAPFSGLTTVFLSSTQALRIMKYKVYARDLFEPLCRIVLVVLAFLLGWELRGAVLAVVASIAVGTWLSFLFYRQAFHSAIADRIQAVFQPRKFLAFSWPLLVANSLYFIELWIPAFMLGHFADAEAVGIFSAVYRTALLVQGILLSFNPIFAPIISDLHHRRQSSKLENLFKIVTKWAFSLSVPAILLLIVFSRQILSFFGPDFVVGGASLIVLSLGQLVNSVTGPLGTMINMSGRSKFTLLNETLHLLLQIGLCLLFIPTYGLMGAALTSTLSLVFLNAIQLLQAYFILGMHPFRIQLLKPLAAGGAAWLVLTLARTAILPAANSIPLLVLGFSIFLVVYGLVLYTLGFDEEDRAVLQRIKTRLA